MTNLNTTARQPSLSLVAKNDGSSISFPSKKLEKKIRNLVARLGRKALKGASKVDPILGRNSGHVSVGASFQRQHGLHLPNVLAALLKHYGLVVFTDHKIPVFQTARSLVEGNTPDALRDVRIQASGDVAFHYKADLVVFCPTSGWLGVFDGKRGLGNSDSSSKLALEPKLRAVHLSVSCYMRMQGYNVVSNDTRVIDFYGQTGYPTDLKVDGCELDDYFGIPVQQALAAFNNAMAVERAKAFNLMAPASGDQTGDVMAQPVSDFLFPQVHQNAVADLLDDTGADTMSLSTMRKMLAAASLPLAA
ncbi:hypothetical protein [Ahrensia sp. R2A130]|uniref:hypothetical protein n=1 Tax=Ahrensia sp. R2A130 TaxID=744979 RepID=UPI0001E0C33C|nr:hypothetical protein [Ahrensia sp. R2A130]EFL89459.1 conserved hypothetical protein [Ahrensia sp. R2A130]